MTTIGGLQTTGDGWRLFSSRYQRSKIRNIYMGGHGYDGGSSQCWSRIHRGMCEGGFPLGGQRPKIKDQISRVVTDTTRLLIEISEISIRVVTDTTDKGGGATKMDIRDIRVIKESQEKILEEKRGE